MKLQNTFLQLVLLFLCLQAFKVPGAPRLLIPLGSYMRTTDLSVLSSTSSDGSSIAGLIVLRINHNQYVFGRNSYTAEGSGLTIDQCWKQGFDISYNNNGRISCNITPESSRDAINAADFLYTELVPYGSYLKFCSGIIKTQEEETSYLYASCHRYRVGVPKSQRFNLSSCPSNDIDIDDDGVLVCTDRAVLPRATSTSGGEHTVSERLPRGNYLLTCKDVKFFPCLGENRRGRLEAQCALNLNGERRYVQAFLEDGDSACRMGNMGYISNINGKLVCDPEQTDFTREETSSWFQCNE